MGVEATEGVSALLLSIDKGYQCGLLLQGAPVEISTFNRRCEGRLGVLESLCSRSARNKVVV